MPPSIIRDSIPQASRLRSVDTPLQVALVIGAVAKILQGVSVAQQFLDQAIEGCLARLPRNRRRRFKQCAIRMYRLTQRGLPRAREQFAALDIVDHLDPAGTLASKGKR